MSLNSIDFQHRLLNPDSGFDFQLSALGEIIKNPESFIRIQYRDSEKKDIFRFSLKFPKSLNREKVYLHTDLMCNGWEMLPFSKSGISEEYILDIPIPRGGYFSFRFVLEKVKGKEKMLYWEPADYHKLLIDPPLVANLRMYTLLPNVSGKISDWIDSLEHIYDMGFNSIHILPITSMGPSESPYSAADHFSIDDHFLERNGNTDEIDRFLKRAEELGICLCFDIVLNHVSDHSTIVREHGNWIIPDPQRPDGLKRAGCWHQGTWISWEDLVLINYKHPDPHIREEIYQYMLEYVLFWIKKAEHCGAIIRLDNLHSSNEEFINWLLTKIRKIAPLVPILSEFFGSREHLAEGVTGFGLNMLTGNTWESPFVPMLTDYLKNAHKKSNPVKYFLSPTSHDTNTAAELFGTAESSIPRYFCCALMGTGQTGIVQGFEYGWESKINFIGRQKRVEHRGEHDFTDIISEINYLLANEDIFLDKRMEFLDAGDDSLIIGLRCNINSGKTVLLAANFNIVEARSFTYTDCKVFTPLLTYRAEVAANNSGNPVIELNSCGICVLRLKSDKTKDGSK